MIERGLYPWYWFCLLFGHAKSEHAGGVDGYWYWRCPRCHLTMDD